MGRVRILVTGVNGFIGRTFAGFAGARGHQVVGVDLGPAAAAGWDHHELDVRDTDALRALLADESITDIVHGGGISGPHVANDDPPLVVDVNLVGTVGLFEAARQAQLPGRVVLLSSSSTYGRAWEERSLTRECTEADALLASEPYGSSKVASEALMRAYIDQFDLDAVALRISIVYGPRRTTYCGITEMIKQARETGVITLHQRAELPLPWVHIDDVCQVLGAALTAPRERLRNGGVFAYNVTGPGHPTFKRIADTIAAELPGTAVRSGNEPDAYDMNARTMSFAAAERDLGWTPHITIETGVAELVRSTETAVRGPVFARPAGQAQA